MHRLPTTSVRLPGGLRTKNIPHFANPNEAFERLMGSGIRTDFMNYSKLAKLREKTDRQLILVIARRLDAGLEYARSGSKLQAKSAQREVRTLIPFVAGPAAEKRRLETRLAQLEAALREATGRLRIQTACP